MPTPIPVTTIPALRYADADAAIAWLITVLGFTEKAVYRDAANNVAHAELTLGNGMVMIGSESLNPETDGWFTTPRAAGAVTSTIYLVVPDCASPYAAAQAAGAEILTPLRTMDYGGGGFSLRDPEGQIWSVGEYNPWSRTRRLAAVYALP